MIVLALAGSVLVGNDFHHGSLPFYLSKPIGRRHYVLGKCLGVGAFVNLIDDAAGGRAVASRPGCCTTGRRTTSTTSTCCSASSATGWC